MPRATDQRIEVRAVGILSLARFLAVFYGTLGFLWAVLVGFLGDMISGGRAPTLVVAVLYILLFAAVGVVVGLIYGLTYNMASALGGLELGIERKVAEATAEEGRGALARRGRHRDLGFIAGLLLSVVVIGGALWVGLLFPVEADYNDCEEQFTRAQDAGWGDTAKTHYYRCMRASQNHPAISVMYPIKRRRMLSWGQDARLALADICVRQGYSLASAALARAYLGGSTTPEGRNAAEAIIAYCKGQGFTAAEIAAASRIRTRISGLTREMVGSGKISDYKIDWTYHITSSSKAPLKSARFAWEICPIGHRGELTENTIGAGQTISNKVSFITHSEASFSSSDIIILPIRACPASR